MDLMNPALNQAISTQKNGEVPVGCVFVYRNKIIASGGNMVNATKNATRHAEFVCIDQVFEFCARNSLDCKQVFEEISVYVTVEPCIMCAAALNYFCVKEIVYGCANDRFGGKTVFDVQNFLNSNIPVIGGVKSEEAMALLKDFYKGENPSAPLPKTKK